MPKIVEFKVAGIKCDYCSWRNDDVKVNEYPIWVNKSCPACGENLLTIEDYRAVKTAYQAVDFLNKWFDWLGYLPWFKMSETITIFQTDTKGKLIKKQ